MVRSCLRWFSVTTAVRMVSTSNGSARPTWIPNFDSGKSRFPVKATITQRTLLFWPEVAGSITPSTESEQLIPATIPVQIPILRTKRQKALPVPVCFSDIYTL